MKRPVVIGIACAAAVVLGGAGYYFLGGDSGPDTAKTPPPKRKPLVPKTYAPDGTLLTGGDSDSESGKPEVVTPADEAWFVVDNEDFRFRACFPGPIERFDNLETAQGAPIDPALMSSLQGYRAERGSTIYSLIVGPLTAAAAADTNVVSSVVSNLPTALAGYTAGTATPFQQGELAGEAVELTAEGMKRFVRVARVQDNIFTLMISGPDVLTPEDPSVSGFWDAFIHRPAKEEVVVEDTGTASGWPSVNGATVGFRFELPSSDVQPFDVLQTLTNQSLSEQLAERWRTEGIRHESYEFTSGPITYSLTALLDTNARAAELTRDSNQKLRMESLLRAIYGVDALATRMKVSGPALPGMKIEDELVTLSAEKVVVVRKARSENVAVLMCVEGPAKLTESDEAVLRFFRSLKVSGGDGAGKRETTKIEKATVIRFHPASGCDLETADGRIVTVKPVAKTVVLDARGKKLDSSPEKFRDEYLKVGSVITVTVNPAVDPTQQRTVKEIQVGQGTTRL